MQFRAQYQNNHAHVAVPKRNGWCGRKRPPCFPLRGTTAPSPHIPRAECVVGVSQARHGGFTFCVEGDTQRHAPFKSRTKLAWGAHGQ
jgi:hypothetical protein